MNFRFWRVLKRDTGELEMLREQRVAAEERLALDQQHVIIPLWELRAENHVQEDLRKLIQRRVRRELGES